MIAGGVLYTVGAVVYAVAWPNPRPRVFGFHEVFHLFVIAAAVAHFAAVAVPSRPHADPPPPASDVARGKSTSALSTPRFLARSAFPGLAAPWRQVGRVGCSAGLCKRKGVRISDARMALAVAGSRYGSRVPARPAGFPVRQRELAGARACRLHLTELHAKRSALRRHVDGAALAVERRVGQLHGG